MRTKDCNCGWCDEEVKITDAEREALFREHGYGVMLLSTDCPNVIEHNERFIVLGRLIYDPPC